MAKSVSHIPFSSTLTHLLEQVSKLETAEASCSENNVDFRVPVDTALQATSLAPPLPRNAGSDVSVEEHYKLMADFPLKVRKNRQALGVRGSNRESEFKDSQC